MADAGTGEHQIAKMNGHDSVPSIKSYRQISSTHHAAKADKMLQPAKINVNRLSEMNKESGAVYNNCAFINNNKEN